MSDDLKAKVQELIDSMINPAVAGHGGFVELVDVQDNRVYLQMGGGCQGCGATDHASGSNPYYQSGKA
jgi:Fe-S cluster biogenesis protein NfuA